MIDARSDAALSPLERLERRVAWGARNLPAARVSGAIVEVSMSHYRVAGLSRFLKLGECVGVDVGDRVQIGEVVRIDEASATLKPFDARCDAAISSWAALAIISASARASARNRCASASPLRLASATLRSATW